MPFMGLWNTYKAAAWYIHRQKPSIFCTTWKKLIFKHKKSLNTKFFKHKKCTTKNTLLGSAPPHRPGGCFAFYHLSYHLSILPTYLSYLLSCCLSYSFPILHCRILAMMLCLIQSLVSQPCQHGNIIPKIWVQHIAKGSSHAHIRTLRPPFIHKKQSTDRW